MKSIKNEDIMNEIQKMNSNYKEMKEDIRKISGTVAVIEKEHGDKLAILLDMYSENDKKFNSHEKRISVCEKKIEKHSDEIYYLSSNG